MDSRVPREWLTPLQFSLFQALRFYGSTDVTVTGITIQNSPQAHLKFDDCTGVMVSGVSISSPGNSPNTDGIHLQNSRDVVIQATNLACGINNYHFSFLWLCTFPFTIFWHCWLCRRRLHLNTNGMQRSIRAQRQLWARPRHKHRRIRERWDQSLCFEHYGSWFHNQKHHEWC